MVLAWGIEHRQLARMTGIDLGELLKLLRSGRQFNEEDYLPDYLLVVQGQMKLGIQSRPGLYVYMLGKMGFSKNTPYYICRAILKAYKKMKAAEKGESDEQ